MVAVGGAPGSDTGRPASFSPPAAAAAATLSGSERRSLTPIGVSREWCRTGDWAAAGAAGRAGCGTTANSDWSACSSGALTELTALEWPPAHQGVHRRRRVCGCTECEDCTWAPRGENTTTYTTFWPLRRGVNAWLRKNEARTRWRCCDSNMINTKSGDVSGVPNRCGGLHPDAAVCPVAALQEVLHKPALLRLHKSSAGGTYMVLLPQTISGETVGATGPIVAVFKPRAEEIGQKRNPHGNCESERVGEFTPGTGSRREVLAYLLDHGGSAGVMPTLEVRATSSGAGEAAWFDTTDCDESSITNNDAEEDANDAPIGSLQYFVPGCVEAADVLPGSFDVDEVHRIAIFDIRTLNNDRHGGNVLVYHHATSYCPRSSSRSRSRGSSSNKPHLIPIDHSYICPSGFADPEFEWLCWPQAKVAFSAASLEYIARLDAEADAALVRRALATQDALDEAGIDAAAEVLWCTTRLLQIAALQYGLSAHAVGQLCRRRTLTTPSVLQELMEEARDESWRVEFAKFEELLCLRLREQHQQQQQL